MCSNCELKKGETTDGYLCKVLVGIQAAGKSCPPSLVMIMAEA